MIKDRLLDTFGDGFAFGNGELRAHGHHNIAVDAMTNPSRSHVVNVDDPRNVGRRMFDLRQDFRLYPIDQPNPHRSGRIFDDEQNGNGDQQTHDGIEDS